MIEVTSVQHRQKVNHTQDIVHVQKRLIFSTFFEIKLALFFTEILNYRKQNIYVYNKEKKFFCNIHFVFNKI